MFTTGFAARADTLTAAERADAVSYAVGLVAEFRRPAAGARVGTSLTVPAVEPPAVWAPDPTGRVVRVPTHLADRFAVYRPEPPPLAAGDLVQVTRNGLNALVCLGLRPLVGWIESRLGQGELREGASDGPPQGRDRSATTLPRRPTTR